MFRRLFVKWKQKNCAIENGIRFIHRSPKIFNIGDYLCSPRHYFKLFSNLNNLTIVGGGVFPHVPYLAMHDMKKYRIDPLQSVLWGAGESKKGFTLESVIVENVPYLEWGVRDIRYLDKCHFLPCVSCCHPMLEQTIDEHATLLFLNRNPSITSSDFKEKFKKLADERRWTLLYNDCTENEMAEALKHHHHIITNSYHGAYWGLLSGHNVTLLGYSSKFINLLQMFDFDQSNLMKYEKGDTAMMFKKIYSIIDESLSIKLDNHNLVLKTFRNINFSFVESLKKKEIIAHYKYKFKKEDDNES